MSIEEQQAEAEVQLALLEQDIEAWRQGNLSYDALSRTVSYGAANPASPALFAPIVPSAAATGLTVAELSKLWFQDHVDINLKPTTAATYRNLMEKRTLPALGHLRPEELTPLVLNRFFNRLRTDVKQNTGVPAKNNATLSSRSIRHHYDVLNYMFSWCLKMDLISANPMKKFDRPKAKRRPLNIITDEQAVELLRCLHKEESLSFRCGVLLALLCGLRLGEVGTLTFQDVDFQNDTITIKQALHYASGHGNYIDDPKSDAGFRTLSLSEGMMELLRATKQYQDEVAAAIGSRWRGTGHIYCNWDGSTMHHDTPSKQWTAFAKKNGFEGVRFYDLRHYHATILIANNIDAVNVAARLGHSDPATTQRVYGHARLSRDRASTAVMDNLYNRALNPADDFQKADNLSKTD
ncbi:MAG: tyrosine-type recombinase/integrase [Christensenellales bacterium]|jgi:integrase